MATQRGGGTYGIPDENGMATGYFYLSYYDKTIESPETIEFSADLYDDSSDFEVLQHDHMPSVNGFYTESENDVTSTANVFEAPRDISVQAVSTRTSEANQRVTLAVYQMNDGATNPTDGKLLYRTSKNFQYAGFHRLSLPIPLTVRAGKKVSVVSTASTVNQQGNRTYSVSVNKGISKEITDFVIENNLGRPTAYNEAVVNEGESFLYKGGQWVDRSKYIAGLPKIEQSDGVTGLPGARLIDQFPIDNFSIKLYTTPAEVQVATVAYHSHVQSHGWEQQWYHDGHQSGTTGQAKRLEAIEMKLENAPFDGSIEYRGHVQRKGWMDWAKDGATCGTTGEAKRLEALQVRLTGDMADRYSVWYRVHSQTWGWLGWAKDDQAAGTSGQAKRVEAVQVQVLPQGQMPEGYVEGEASYIGAVTADVHLQKAGWTGARSALEFGTTGQARRLEAMKLTASGLPVNAGMSYEVHAQKNGWIPPVADGAQAGTTGEAKRLEAVKISLTGDAAKDGGYSVWYRVHSQTYGWLGWAHDGQEAGTTGLGKRAEAIDVQVLPQGQVPRGYDASKAACVSTPFA